MKKIILGLIFIIALINSINAFAHPWNTASDWCHYCRTNCSSRWVGRDVRHCHWWGTSSSYSNYSTPTYSCPSNSYLSWTSCQCNYWYYASWSSCVKEKTCTDLFWWNSKDNYDWTCGCNTGYSFVTDTLWTKTCTKDKTCTDLFWWNSKDNYDWTCGCNTGYSFVTDTLWTKTCTKDKTPTQVCHSYFWVNTYSDWTKADSWWYNCYCNEWYNWNTKWDKCERKIIQTNTTVLDKAEIALNKKVDIIFDKLKSKYNKYSETEKYKKYKLLSENLEKFKIKKSDNIGLIKIIDRLIFLLNKELSNNLNNDCDEVSQLLGLCEIK
jgi:hypothetical protein